MSTATSRSPSVSCWPAQSSTSPSPRLGALAWSESDMLCASARCSYDRKRDAMLEPTASNRQINLERALPVRRRYKVARWIAAMLGGLLALASAKSTLLRLEAAQVDLGVKFFGGAALLVLLGAAGCWLLAEALWRRTRRRNRWKWQ
jgi:hypothetical protein